MSTKVGTNRERFRCSRNDGRSNVAVVLDVVRGRAPGEVISYGELCSALSIGADRAYERADIGSIISAAYPRLLREQARALHCIRGQGYRVAPAQEHGKLADQRQTKADRQMLRGLQTLRHVRWDEMGENERMAHEGQLMVVEGMFRALKALEHRQSAVEQAIKRARSGDDLFR